MSKESNVDVPKIEKIVLKQRSKDCKDCYINLYKKYDIDIVKGTDCAYTAEVVDGNGNQIALPKDDIHFQIYNALWYFLKQSQDSIDDKTIT